MVNQKINLQQGNSQIYGEQKESVVSATRLYPPPSSFSGEDRGESSKDAPPCNG